MRTEADEDEDLIAGLHREPRDEELCPGELWPRSESAGAAGWATCQKAALKTFSLGNSLFWKRPTDWARRTDVQSREIDR